MRKQVSLALYRLLHEGIMLQDIPVTQLQKAVMRRCTEMPFTKIDESFVIMQMVYG